MTPLALGATRGGRPAPRAATVRRGAGARPGSSGDRPAPRAAVVAAAAASAVLRPAAPPSPAGGRTSAAPRSRTSTTTSARTTSAGTRARDAGRVVRNPAPAERPRGPDPLGGHPVAGTVPTVGSLQSSSSSPGRGARDVRRDRGPRRDARDTFTGPNHRRRRRRRAHSDARPRPRPLRRVRETTTRGICGPMCCRAMARRDARPPPRALLPRPRRPGGLGRRRRRRRSRVRDAQTPEVLVQVARAQPKVRVGRRRSGVGARGVSAGPTRRSGPGPTLPRPSRLRRRGVRRHNICPRDIVPVRVDVAQDVDESRSRCPGSVSRRETALGRAGAFALDADLRSADGGSHPARDSGRPSAAGPAAPSRRLRGRRCVGGAETRGGDDVPRAQASAGTRW